MSIPSWKPRRCSLPCHLRKARQTSPSSWTWIFWMSWGTLRALKVETRAIHSGEQTLSPFDLGLRFQTLGQPLLSA